MTITLSPEQQQTVQGIRAGQIKIDEGVSPRCVGAGERQGLKGVPDVRFSLDSSAIFR
jgi:hypothetical protein